jgi:5-formyltetrahydrofolate cyclo-ligase
MISVVISVAMSTRKMSPIPKGIKCNVPIVGVQIRSKFSKQERSRELCQVLLVVLPGLASLEQGKRIGNRVFPQKEKGKGTR